MNNFKTSSQDSVQTISLDDLATITGGRLFNTPEERSRGTGLFRTNRDRGIEIHQRAHETGDARLNNEFFNTDAVGGRFRELPPR